MRKWGLRLLLGFGVFIALLLIVPMLIPLPTVGADPAQFAELDGRFTTVDGLQTYVREQGSPDAPPVLLLHGFGGSTFSWRDTIAPLANAGFRVIAFDRPPYGLSAKMGDNIPYAPDAAAAFTALLMDELGIERATLVGHSAGGGVIAHFATRYPERVERLVFVDGAVQVADRPVQPTSSGASAVRSSTSVPPFFGSLLGFEPFNRLARLTVRGVVRPDSFAELQRSAYANPADVTPEVAAGYAEQLQVRDWDIALINILRGSAFGGERLTQAQIRSITVPTLIVWGADDTWVSLAQGVALEDELPNDTLIIYPEIGHLPMEESPDRFNRDLIAFLQDQPIPIQESADNE